MKNLFITCFLIAIYSINISSINAQHINQYPFNQHMHPRKSNKEKIDLVNKCERRLDVSLPKVLLFKTIDHLEASILSNDYDIRVQIIGEGNFVLFETTVNKLQQEWQLDINFLQPDKRYKIKFIPSTTGGYLFGYFQK